MSRTFIRNSVAYYRRTGYSYSDALRHANADLQWWRENLGCCTTETMKLTGRFIMYNYNASCRDADDAMAELETRINNLGSADVESISECFSEVKDAFMSLETEIGYLTVEHEDFENELGEWRELGECPDDVAVLTDAESEEYEKLKEEREFFKRDKEQMERIVVERDNLREMHENQRLTIERMFRRFEELNQASSLDSVLEVINTGPVADDKQVLVIDTTKLPTELPPNCS